MVDFVEAHRDAHGVEPICAVLPIAPSTYYDHLAKRTDPARFIHTSRIYHKFQFSLHSQLTVTTLTVRKTHLASRRLLQMKRRRKGCNPTDAWPM